jgi:DNA-binding LytR/AlgR family response regulator
MCVRVHGGFVVNLRRAVEVRPQLSGTAVVMMGDGAEVSIARRQVDELRRNLI